MVIQFTQQTHTATGSNKCHFRLTSLELKTLMSWRVDTVVFNKFFQALSVVPDWREKESERQYSR